MELHLIVREAFNGYAKGQRIDDADTVAAIIAGENRPYVIPIAAAVVEPVSPPRVPATLPPVEFGKPAKDKV